jgi:hypothetical protein
MHPPTPSLPQFIQVISGYPLAPSPDIFGLHDNADITCEQASGLIRVHALCSTHATPAPFTLCTQQHAPQQ